MAGVPGFLLLGVAVCALGATGLRLASVASTRPVWRLLAAAPLAAALAVLEALVLGLAGWGTNPWALSAAAVAGWLAVRRSVSGSSDAVPLRTLAAPALATVDRRTLALLGAAGGLVVVWTAFLLRHPVIGTDGLTYHLGDVVAWLGDGRPGSRHLLVVGLPVQAYPQTGEVLFSWVTSLGRDIATVAPLLVGLVVLLATAVYAGTRELGLSRLSAALAAGALATQPLVLAQLAFVNTDTPALAWLACTAALAVAARREPALLAPMLVAAGLAIGTKTTTVPIAVVVVALALLAARRAERARPRAAVVVGGLVVGLAVGVPWYLRDLIAYGSPFYPFLTPPWGDPIPPVITRLGASFLADPVQAVREAGIGGYLRVLGGGAVLLAGVPLVAVLRRHRAVLALAGITVASALLWARAPFTGYVDSVDIVLGGLRYLLPTLLVAAATVALAAVAPGARSSRSARAGHQVAVAVLVLAVLADAVTMALLGFPVRPRLRWIAVGVVAGALLLITTAYAVRAVRAPRRAGRWTGSASSARPGAVVPVVLVPVVVVMALSAAFGVAAAGALDRHVAVSSAIRLGDAPVLSYLLQQPAYRDGHAPVLTGPTMTATLAGPDLAHPVSVVAPDTPCARLREQARTAWLVLAHSDGNDRYGIRYDLRPCLAGRVPAYRYDATEVYPPTG